MQVFSIELLIEWNENIVLRHTWHKNLDFIKIKRHSREKMFLGETQ